MMKISRRTFLKSGLSGAALVACGTVPTKWIRPAKASVVAKKLRTTAGAVMPVPVPASSPKLLPTDLAQYSQHGYGNWQIGEGIAGYINLLDSALKQYFETIHDPALAVTSVEKRYVNYIHGGGMIL